MVSWNWLGIFPAEHMHFTLSIIYFNADTMIELEKTAGIAYVHSLGKNLNRLV